MFKNCTDLRLWLKFTNSWELIWRWFGFDLTGFGVEKLILVSFNIFQSRWISQISLRKVFLTNLSRWILKVFSYLWNRYFWSNFHSNYLFFHLLLFSGSKYIKRLICIFDVLRGKYLVHLFGKKKYFKGLMS